MDTPRGNYSRRHPLRQAPGQIQLDLVATARTHSLPFADTAGTSPPRREVARPRRGKALRPVQTEGQLAMALPDREELSLGHPAIESNSNSDEDDSSAGPSPSPAPTKPKPAGPGSRTSRPEPLPIDTHAPVTSDIGGADAPSIPPQMFDWPTFPSQDMGVTTSEPLNNEFWTPTNWMTKKYGKPKYRRDNSAYDLAQTTERPAFLKLLAELCAGIEEPPQSMGRPRMLMRDMVFSAVHKVYSLFSLRRHTSELCEAKAHGYIDRVPQYNTVCKYMQLPELTHILMDLVTASAIPMKHLEDMVLMDSTGFSTCRFVRWFNKRWGKEIDTREWVKAHLTCGANTKIVTAVVISGWDAHDTNFFKPLLERTLKHFAPESLAADKAYLSINNVHLAMLSGVVPYIPFKSNTKVPTEDSNSAWAAMYHYLHFNRHEYYHHYHRRSNVETAVHMIKSKFGDSLRSKNYLAQVNETLAKVLCHNIVENHKASVMLGLDINYQPMVPVQREMVWQER